MIVSLYYCYRVIDIGTGQQSCQVVDDLQVLFESFDRGTGILCANRVSKF